jgi:aspartate 1-decarboxylase
MLRKVLHSKIHMAQVTAAKVDYSGSITIDADLLEQAGLRASDVVLVANCRTGARFETYVFRGEPGSSDVVLHGAGARLADVGDPLIILHFAHVDDEEYRRHRPTVLILGEGNTVERKLHYEPR